MYSKQFSQGASHSLSWPDCNAASTSRIETHFANMENHVLFVYRSWGVRGLNKIVSGLHFATSNKLASAFLAAIPISPWRKNHTVTEFHTHPEAPDHHGRTFLNKNSKRSPNLTLAQRLMRYEMELTFVATHRPDAFLQ